MEWSAEELIRLLSLSPLRGEGGFFRETHRSDLALPSGALPSGYRGPRPAVTAIYYLLGPGTHSAMHRLRGDEIFHFYLGDPVEMLQLSPDGTGRLITIGTAIERGAQPQVVVPAGVWQGSRLAAGGRFALMGTTVAPGFDFSDFELGEREALVRGYPAHAEMITALTAG